MEFFIVAVPTPIDSQNIPDLTPLLGATRTVGQVLKKNDYVVYESTVYPGCTEEDCVPLLERLSNLKFVEDFKVGYSPERINPGDKEHTLGEHREGEQRLRSGERRDHRQGVRTGGEGRACIARRASKWPRLPRSSRTRSAT